jgi:hypothetical protein
MSGSFLISFPFWGDEGFYILPDQTVNASREKEDMQATEKNGYAKGINKGKSKPCAISHDDPLRVMTWNERIS